MADVPVRIADVIDDFGGIFVPEEIKDEIETWEAVGDAPTSDLTPTARVYLIAMNKRCMTCTRELGDQTTIIASPDGVLFIYCSGRCLVDKQIMGFLEETHDDLNDQITFRTKGGN